MTHSEPEETYDFVIVGSGFGGSVSAMRLTQKGYRVLVLERGKRFRDEDFPRSNWLVSKYLWAPALRCFGIFQVELLNDVMILHGSGVGGGSLVYANVLEVPDDQLFNAPAWRHLADWKAVLAPYYDVGRRMLGVARNPRLEVADRVLERVAAHIGKGDSFRPTEVGVFFGYGELPGEEIPDPYFGGEGPSRRGCIYCGGCMVGCRYNAKNTLVKNYLYLAEKWGCRVRPECEVTEIIPLPEGQPDGARYELVYRSSTAWLVKPHRRLRARNVVVSAGVLGTLKLLLHCRDVSRSLPELSPTLGEFVRTNSEELLGSFSREKDVDYSQGLAITSIFQADPWTYIEPVRYPKGSSLIRLLSTPMIGVGDRLLIRWLKTLGAILARPADFLRSHILPGWAQRTTIIMAMQTKDNLMRISLGRNAFTFFRRGLVTKQSEGAMPPMRIEVGHQVAKAFADHTDGVLLSSVGDGLFNIPTTAHIMGGCPIGRDAGEGVVDTQFQVHHYPGLYVVDGSVLPANPGVNPSLTITALAEYAMSQFAPRENHRVELPLGVNRY